MADTINALVQNDVNEISLVPKGANKKKKILFFKSDNTQGDNLMEEEKTFEEIFKELLDHPDGPAIYGDPNKVEDFLKQAKLSDKAVNAVKGALRILNSVKADLPAGMLAKLAGLLGEGYAAPKEEKPEKPEEVKKEDKENKLELDGIPEPIAKALKEQGGQIALLKEEKDKLAEKLSEATDTIIRKEFEEKVKTDFSNIPIAATDLVEKLITVAKSGDAELSETVDSILKTADKLAGESKVFDEFGSGAGGSGSAYTKIEKIAEEYRKTDPKMTEAAAIAKATLENPELYADYEKEMN